MNKKQIKKLAESSYNKNNLDPKKVNRIAKHLERSELKAYITALKNLEKEKSVVFISPKITGQKEIARKIEKIFTDKKIKFKEDKSLIAGIRIINKDDVYDLNIKNTLENLISHLGN